MWTVSTDRRGGARFAEKPEAVAPPESTRTGGRGGQGPAVTAPGTASGDREVITLGVLGAVSLGGRTSSLHFEGRGASKGAGLLVTAARESVLGRKQTRSFPSKPGSCTAWSFPFTPFQT